jgi:hypothetical protein
VPAADSRQSLAALLTARVGVVAMACDDEERAVALVRVAAESTRRATFRWSVTDGMTRIDVQTEQRQWYDMEPTTVLRNIRDSRVPGIYVLLDMHPYLTDPVVVRLLKDVATAPVLSRSTIVLVSPHLDVPDDLDHLAMRFEVAFPTREERAAIVDDVLRSWTTATGAPPLVDPQARALLVERLAGLTFGDAQAVARSVVLDDGALVADDLPRATEAKRSLLAGNGVLTYEPAAVSPDDLAGMHRLKAWLAARRPALDGSAPVLRPPRGVLLLGVQGCGKSAAAKASATLLGAPLLRMDVAAIYDKYVGESERRLRESLAAAEALAPCVLWVDELEKAIATSGDDGGASRRLLGSFLTWLAEHRAPVFVVATANDITALPPELVRKGRFDEIFFVDLPDEPTRAQILTIHSGANGLTLTAPEAAGLAAASPGFSGAELEAAVVAATYRAYGGRTPLTAGDVLDELRGTSPLALVMDAQVAALRAWAAPRTVPA